VASVKDAKRVNFILIIGLIVAKSASAKSIFEQKRHIQLLLSFQ